ncbi:CCA tRNA nucleotidyltransferase [uncultured Limosilactobacillus sp.]|uniref:CCA tRNA nucleotidyltransferase n=1 Tax=uncultured Limosilactobacillus sp. TaxID=2837629 RepID=UPI0025DF149A|nr:CCA tRNA nucleotidyltransferase [uncultured Limosilactobacillus sp.]
MIIEQLPTEFKEAEPVLAQIEAAGFEAYFVGGCVRDTILGQPLHDIDIATSAYPSEIKAIFSRTVDTGIEHGTVMILDHGKGYETTTFRTETGYQDFRRPDEVTFVRSLAEDLQRRDFTINALALKRTGEVIDLFDGLHDLTNRLIRAVGNPDERFHEDALRMMRAVRFASQLDFEIDPETIQGITDNAHLLSKIAVERIQVELEKLFVGTNPTKGLQVMMETDLYEYTPTLADQSMTLKNLLALDNWHLTSPVSVWATLMFAGGHDDQTIPGLLKQWKLSNDCIKESRLVVQFLDALQNHQVTPELLFKMNAKRLQWAHEVAQVLNIEHDQATIMRDYAQLPIHDAHELAIKGGDLITGVGIKPGPQLGQIIRQLQVAVLTQKAKNQPVDLIALASKLKG